MSETAIGALTAGDLTPEHYGCLLVWEEPTSLGPVNREVVFDELRRFIVRGERRVEIIDRTPAGPWTGSARFLDASTPVGVGRRIRKASKRRWSKMPLLTWEELEAESMTTETAIAFRAYQRMRDNEPCPTCGGDRLRTDFTGSGRCHAAQSDRSER